MVGAAVLVAGALAFGLTVGDSGDESVRLSGENRTPSTTTNLPTTLGPTTPVDETSTTGMPAASTVPTTAPASPTTSGSAAPVTPPPPRPVPSSFASSIETVTLEQLGASWRPDLGCPGPEELRAVNVSHWGYDGNVREGRVIVAASQAEGIVAVFRDIFAARFPIERMIPIDAYGGDDQASMRANNTSGFNCRTVAGSTRLSQHGLGLAVDVNPLMNPYVEGSMVDPPEGEPYADRSRDDVGMIKPNDVVVKAFAVQGWEWGGYWSSGQDYQHFSANGG